MIHLELLYHILSILRLVKHMETLLVILISNSLLILLVLCIEKRHSEIALAWILLLLFFPILGFLLYLMFGTTYKFKLLSKTYSIKKIEKEEEAKYHRNKNHTIKLPTNYYNMRILNEQHLLNELTEGNKVELLIDGEEKFSSLWKDIEKSKEAIYMEYFIFKTKDEIGKQLLNLLEKKLKEGVEVKIIYDRLGNLKTRNKDFKRIKKLGGKVSPYLPSIIFTIFSLNFRLHRKLVIIDHKIAYTGGINIGDDYLGKDKRVHPWRDTSIRITGPSVANYELRFFYDWYYLNQKEELPSLPIHPAKTGTTKLQLISSGPDSYHEYVKNSYLKILAIAKNYLYIETPYFIPDESFINMIKIAKLSGVDIKIIVPGVPDKQFVYEITLSYLEELIESGIEVYTYRGFIHSKVMISDDYITSIGSCNVDSRSFLLNYELNTLIYEKEFTELNKKQFFEDLANSDPLTLEKIEKRSFFSKIYQSLCRLLAPLS